MLLNTSATPNIPQMRTMKSKPPSNCGTPKANRGIPLTTSRPTVVSSRPSIVEMMTLNGFSPPNTVRRPKAIIVRAKNSAGPKRRPNFAKAGAKAIRTTMEPVPAIHEPIAATERAAPARPCNAIW